MKIAIGSDHAATALKATISRFLEERGVEVVDVGTADPSVSVDYPDFGVAVARLVADGQVDQGVLMCGTGIGMSIVANKVPGIRAALVHDLSTARLAREHNDANVLVLGGRLVQDDLARQMVAEWLDRPFEERHQRRLDKIAEIERSFRS